MYGGGATIRDNTRSGENTGQGEESLRRLEVEKWVSPFNEYKISDSFKSLYKRGDARRIDVAYFHNFIKPFDSNSAAKIEGYNNLVKLAIYPRLVQAFSFVIQEVPVWAEAINFPKGVMVTLTQGRVGDFTHDMVYANANYWLVIRDAIEASRNNNTLVAGLEDDELEAETCKIVDQRSEVLAKVFAKKEFAGKFGPAPLDEDAGIASHPPVVKLRDFINLVAEEAKKITKPAARKEAQSTWNIVAKGISKENRALLVQTFESWIFWNPVYPKGVSVQELTREAIEQWTDFSLGNFGPTKLGTLVSPDKWAPFAYGLLGPVFAAFAKDERSRKSLFQVNRPTRTFESSKSAVKAKLRKEGADWRRYIDDEAVGVKARKKKGEEDDDDDTIMDEDDDEANEKATESDIDFIDGSHIADYDSGPSDSEAEEDEDDDDLDATAAPSSAVEVPSKRRSSTSSESTKKRKGKGKKAATIEFSDEEPVEAKKPAAKKADSKKLFINIDAFLTGVGGRSLIGSLRLLGASDEGLKRLRKAIALLLEDPRARMLASREYWGQKISYKNPIVAFDRDLWSSPLLKAFKTELCAIDFGPTGPNFKKIFEKVEKATRSSTHSQKATNAASVAASLLPAEMTERVVMKAVKDPNAVQLVDQLIGSFTNIDPDKISPTIREETLLPLIVRGLAAAVKEAGNLVRAEVLSFAHPKTQVLPKGKDRTEEQKAAEKKLKVFNQHGGMKTPAEFDTALAALDKTLSDRDRFVKIGKAFAEREGQEGVDSLFKGEWVPIPTSLHCSGENNYNSLELC